MPSAIYSPTSFERQVERINSLIEGEGAQVTWNDHVPDPDNPQQARQIDVSIIRDNLLTLVECRHHKSPQNVKWIEELMGRRISLKADAAIAVSSSGFTEGAIKKAGKHGIFLRDMHQITDDEVRSWGCRTTVNLMFYEFTETKLLFELDNTSLDRPVEFTGADGKAFEWRLFFQKIINELTDFEGLDIGIGINRTFRTKGLKVNGTEPKSIKWTGRVRKLLQDYDLAYVSAYHPPRDLVSSVFIEKKIDNQSEVIQHGDRVSAVFDLSTVNIPENHFLHIIQADFGRKVTLTGVRFIGTSEWLNFDAVVDIEFKLKAS